MKHQIPTYLHHQVACPSCGILSDISYCTKEQEYIWWCQNEECGKQYKFIIHEDWSIDAEPTGVLVETNVVGLRLRKELLTNKDLVIYLQGSIHSKDGIRDTEYGDKPFCWEEYTCPVNLFNKGVDVRLGDIQDPHNIFEHISTYTWQEWEKFCEEEL